MLFSLSGNRCYYDYLFSLENANLEEVEVLGNSCRI